MCRFRQRFNEAHLAFLFGISQPTVSRIFVSWINFMYLRFGTINIWPNREEVDKSMPEDFNSKYPKTRVILNFTETKFQIPRQPAPEQQNIQFLQESHHSERTYWNTPSGAITFISELYAGSISDREIVERSGILDYRLMRLTT